MLRLLTSSLRLAGAMVLAPYSIAAQDTTRAAIDTTIARRYFQEANALTARDAGRLWGRTLAGPLLFVDRGSRQILTDRADGEGRLRPLGALYAGVLPASENIANTAFRWGGVSWAMLAWPVTSDSLQRSVLLAHELWHRVQDSLGFPLASPTNAQLAQRDGRLWLRLEALALKRALSLEGIDRARALRDAIAFRRTRRRLFPGSDSTERALELNEGLAEYTGVTIGAGSERERRELVERRLEVLDSATHLERSFAYQTGPAYGYFLDALSPGWRGTLSRRDDLAFVLESSLHGAAPSRGATVITRAERYGYARIRKEEQSRATKAVGHLTALHRRFVIGPVLELPLAEMKMGFDPGQVEALEGVGTIYGTLRLTDRWGVLQCDASGGVISPDFRRAIVPAPTDTAGRRLTGPGWVLELLPEWQIVAGARRGDWIVKHVTAPLP